MAPTLQPGQTAPAFTLNDDQGKPVSLSDYAGQTVILYAYPKADTPGCTTQACDFRDALASLQAHGYVVLGISPDTPEQLAAFRAKYGLPFPLLSDSDHQVLERYAAWGEKNSYGRTTTGVIRSTFVIDGQGQLTHVLPNVKASGHVAMLRRKLGIDT